MLTAKVNTAGARKAARRHIRNVLGTTREVAPEARQAIVAAGHTGTLMEDATNGRFTVAIIDNQRGVFLGQADALRIAKGGVS